MTRGRKRDTTITPSRQLALQRAYRDKRATYVAELEARLRDIEEENKQLKAEVEQLRSALKEPVNESARTSGYDVAQATADLQQKLQDASDSLANYRNFVLGQHVGSQGNTISTNSTENSSEKHCDSEDCDRDPLGCIVRLVSAAQGRNEQEPMTSSLASSENGPVLLDDAESECCGGLLDCTGLVFDDMEEVGMHSTTSVPTSNVRTEN